MRASFSSPIGYRVITSPLGALFDSRFVENIRFRRLPAALRLRRLGAVGVTLRSSHVDDLLGALGVVEDVPERTRRRLSRGLLQLAGARARRDDIERQWERAFFGDAWPPPSRDELVRIEHERNARARACAEPSASLGFFATSELFAPIRFEIPSPGDLAARWAQELVRPELAYVPPSELPSIERSRRIPGPTGDEYWVRFRSPSALGDMVHARVFEPARADVPRAAFIYMAGLFASCDAAPYAPEADTIGRLLATRGYRVIVPEPPWHGRRAPRGRATGEACLATAPEGLFRCCAAGAIEMAVLVAWARQMGSCVVGIGGASLGALVAQALAGRARSFPRGMRPDTVFLAGATCFTDELLLSAKLATKIGLGEAILAAGWTREALACLRDLMDPPREPGLSPERIFAVLGQEDAFLPCGRGRDLLQQWRVPAQNVTLLPCGERGLALYLARRDDLQRAFGQSLSLRG